MAPPSRECPTPLPVPNTRLIWVVFVHWHIPNLDLPVARLGVLVQVDVDGEMGIDVAHLVAEALGDTDDQVVDDGADGAEGGNVLADTVVDLDADEVLLDDREVDGDVAEVLGELAARALDRNEPRLDRDLDCWADNTSAHCRCFSPFPDSNSIPHPLPKPPPIPLLNPPRSTGRCRSLIAGHGSALLVSVSGLHTMLKLANVPFSGTSRVSSLWM